MNDDRLVDAYAAIVIGGARFEDERLARMRALMTLDEIERAKALIAAEWLRVVAPDSRGDDADVVTLVELYLRVATSGARPDDPRLAALMNGMTNDELERTKQAIGLELLLRQPIPPRPQ